MGRPICKEAILVALALSVLSAQGQARAAGGQAVAEHPGAAPDSAAHWLEALRAKGPIAHERALIVAPDGEVLETLEGLDGPNRVEMPMRVRSYFADGEKPMLLVHNHPAGTGLSKGDLALLAFPGVRAVIAVGHDGSLYEASANAPIDSAAFERSVYDPARALLEFALRGERFPFDRTVARDNTAHLMALVLARAGVIEYRATLGGARRGSWASNQSVFDRIVKSTGDTLRKRLSAPRVNLGTRGTLGTPEPAEPPGPPEPRNLERHSNPHPERPRPAHLADEA